MEFFNTLDDELDIIDILAYQIVTAISNWMNPIDRHSQNKRFFSSISSGFKEFFLGQSESSFEDAKIDTPQPDPLASLQSLAPESAEAQYKMPKKMESQEILDMLYKFDPKTNTTVMIALMNGGTLSSFEIDSDYEM